MTDADDSRMYDPDWDPIRDEDFWEDQWERECGKVDREIKRREEGDDCFHGWPYEGDQ